MDTTLRLGFKVAGITILVLSVVALAIYFVNDYQESDALRRAQLSAESAERTAKLNDDIYEQQMRLVGLKIGPLAEATWRAKKTEVQRCQNHYGDQSNCKALLAAFQKATTKR